MLGLLQSKKSTVGGDLKKITALLHDNGIDAV